VKDTHYILEHIEQVKKIYKYYKRYNIKRDIKTDNVCLIRCLKMIF